MVIGALFALAVSAADGFLGPRAIWTATVAAWALASVTAWWCRVGGRHGSVHDPRVGAVVRWHVTPLLVWFCLPGKLQGFLWFQVPFTNAGERPSGNPFGGLGTYRSAFVDDYHPSVAAAAVVAVLAVVGVVAWRRGRLARGGGLIVAFVLVSLVLLLPHPNRKSRFLHTVVPAVWILAGTGAGALASSDRRWVGRVAAGATAVGALGLVSGSVQPGSAPEGGLQAERPSLLPVVAAHLPAVEAAQHPVVLSDVPMRFLARWTQRVHDPDGSVVETEVPGFDAARRGATNAAAVDRWLDDEPVDLVVVVRLGPSSPWYVEPPGNEGLAQLVDLVGGRDDFRPVVRRISPPGGTDRDAAVVELWHRVAVGGR